MSRYYSLSQLVVFLAVLVIPINNSQALIFGRDDRVLISSNQNALFAPVGIVYGTAEAAHATAFLIDDCHALTVQHAFGQRFSAIGRKVTFAAQVRGPFKRWRTSPAEVVAEGGLHARQNLTNGFAKWTYDWALLRLKKCLGKTFGHVQLSSRAPKGDEIIGIAGYPVDKSLSDGVVVDPSCRVRDVKSDALLHDCATLPGNSGSPLYRIVSEKGRESLEVFAMNSAGHSFNVPGANLVLPVREYLPNYAGIAVPTSPMVVSVDAR